jgi:hypothetical protein
LMRRLAIFALALPLLAYTVARLYAQPSIAGHQQGATGWSCSLDDIGATLTRCALAPEEGSTLYITDLVGQSTTGTAGQFILRTGTGSNCGTGTASLLPSAATAARIVYPANTAAPTHLRFGTPIRVPHGKDLCLLGVATQTFTGQIWGYVGPK